MRGVGPADGVRGREALAHPGRVEPRQAGSPDLALGDLGPGSCRLGGAARDREGAAAVVAAVDPLPLHDPADVGHGPLQGGDHGPGCRAPVTTGHGGRGHRPQRGHPPAVASRGAEADVLGLEDEHVEPRVGPQQVVGAPQPGEAPADDDDVGRRRQQGTPPVGGPVGAPGSAGRRVGPERPAHIRSRAPSRTERSRCSMSSNSGCPIVSGGASWMTGSPRSSARQYSPASRRALDR